MGTQNSNFNEIEFINEETKFWGSSICQSNINKEGTITSSNENNENKEIIKILNKQEEINKSSSTSDKSKNDFIPFKFEWKDEDNLPKKELEVMITGTFLNNWNMCIPMIKNPKTNIYEYQTSLPREKHFFKFIVNNNWKCSNLYPTIKDDSNNTNNYIDLTNYSLVNSNKNENKKEDKKENNNNKISYTKELYEINNEGYDCKYPLIKDLNLTAPNVMINYQKLFCLECHSNQGKLSDVFNSDKIYKNRNYLNQNNNCYQKIFNFPQEKLEHLAQNIEGIYSFKRYMRFSITERNIDKLLTFVYYRPK